MAEGLEVINDGGHIQISSKNKNILLAKWSRVNSSNTSVFKPTAMIVAIKPDEGEVMYKPSRNVFIDSGVVGKGIVYEFDWGVDDGSNVGLQIFNADGTAAYKSSKNALRVIDSGTVRAYESWTKQYDRPVAVVFNQTVTILRTSGTQSASIFESFVRIDKTGTGAYQLTVGTGDVVSFFQPNPVGKIGTDTAYFLVVDASTLPDAG